MKLFTFLPMVISVTLLCGVLLGKASKRLLGQPTVTAKHAVAKHPAASSVSSKRLPSVASVSHAQSAALEPGDLEALARFDKGVKLAHRGTAETKQGNWPQAEEHYRQALAIWPENREALYGLGQHAEAVGDVAGAIAYYRTAIYTNDPNQSSDGFRENNGSRLMEYAILLSEAGQAKEALTIYRRAEHVVDYIDGHQNVDVLLPTFRPGGWAYTPKRLRAMAHIGIALDINGNDDKAARVHLQKAVALAPDSPLSYFYRGQAEYKWFGQYDKAKADYEYARQFGNAEVEDAVEKEKATRDYLR